MKFFKNYINKPLQVILSLAMVIVFAFLPASSLLADGETAVIRMGQTWQGVIDHGGTATFDFRQYAWFPNDWNCQGSSMQDASSQTGSGLVMATTNWVDPLGNLIEKAAVQWSTSSDYNDIIGDMVQVPMTNYVRWDIPLNYTIQPEDEEIENKQVDAWGEADATKMVGTSDQVVEVTTKNELGVEIHRKVFAWAQEHHDNYIVCDITLTNKSGKTLTDFWFGTHHNSYYNRKAATGNPGVTLSASTAISWQHYYGGRPGDSLRISYGYSADDITTGNRDDMALPIYDQDGRLWYHEMQFYATLHASKAPYTNDADDEDDFLQPKVTDVYSRPLIGLTEVYARPSANRPEMYDYIAGRSWEINPMEGAFEGTYHQANNDEFGNPDWAGSLPGMGFTSTFHGRYMNYGPYPEFKDGEKLRLIIATGFGELGIKQAKAIGEEWKAGTLEKPPGIPDQNTGYFPSNFEFGSTDQIDINKNIWYSTVVDSIHRLVSMAKWNYEHNWMVPQAPQPPHMYVQGTGEGTEIRWSAEDAEAQSDFYGYRIMRRIGAQDTVFYEEIARFTADQLTSETIEIGDQTLTGYKYIDTDVLWGADYYYYVQSGVKVSASDANAYPTTRGKVIWSGRVWSTSRLRVSPERSAGEQLSEIRIVPNPYYLDDEKLQGYGLESNDPRLLMFFNLPPVVTIRIFSESGDMVKTIEHAPISKSGLFSWDMLTDNQQAIASGVYIAVFETPEGGVAYQKFIIVR